MVKVKKTKFLKSRYNIDFGFYSTIQAAIVNNKMSILSQI